MHKTNVYIEKYVSFVTGISSTLGFIVVAILQVNLESL